jgi:hypothetical protein
VGRILVGGYVMLVLNRETGNVYEVLELESKINFFKNPDIQVERQSFFFVGHEGIEEISVKYLSE